MLVKELDELDKPEVPVKIFHMKPQYLEEISAELASCQKYVQILDGNERFVFLTANRLTREVNNGLV